MGQASAEKFKQTELAEKERVALVPQSKQLARTPEPPFPKEKEQCHLSRSPDIEMGESQGEQKPHLGEREGN